MCRLGECLEVAHQQGWRNVTEREPKLKEGNVVVSEFRPLRVRHRNTFTNTFLRLVNDELVEHIADISTATLRGMKDTTRGPKPTITEQDIRAFIAEVIAACAGKITDLRSHFAQQGHKGLGQHQYQRIRSALGFDTGTLMGIFNDNLKATLKPGGHGVIDETIWEWTARNEFVRCIPRKPKDEGIVAYAFCFTLTRTGRPVLWHLIPDLRIPVLRPDEIMEAMVAVWPDRPITVTTDCYFTHIGWLEKHKDLPFTSSLASNDLATLWPLLTYNLQYHQYRMFQIGDMIATFWFDNKVVANITTAFTIEKDDVQQGYHRGTDLTGLKRSLTLHSIPILLQLGLEDLQALAFNSGHTAGMI